MKTYSKERLEAARPDSTDRTCVEYCLSNLYESDKLSVDDQITPGFTYEELIGALLLARDAIDERDTLLKEKEEKEWEDQSLSLHALPIRINYLKEENVED